MALSAEERQSLIEETRDERRREILRRYRRVHVDLSCDEVLDFLRQSSETFVDQDQQGSRPRISGQHFLL